MNPTLDIDLLRSLVAFADTGSFTRAADRVGRTQSAISMQMRRLEDQVGRPIFERRGREVHLSADGVRLLAQARRLLKLHDETVARFNEPALAGTVRVGAPDDYATTYLPVLLSRFAEMFPEVSLEVVCESSEDLRERLQRGTLDLAILTCGAEQADGERSLVLKREPVIWATAGNHDAHLRRPLPLALFQEPCEFRTWGIRALDQAGVDYRVAYCSVNMTALFAAVHAGLAVTLVVESSMTHGMRVLGPEEGFPSLPMATIALQWASGAQSPPAQRLIEHITESFRASSVHPRYASTAA